MPRAMPDPLDLPQGVAQPPDTTSPPKKDSDLSAYRYAKALCQSAIAGSTDRQKTFKANWDYLIGKGHFNNWATLGRNDLWQFRGVVNWTYATVKTKAAILTSAKSEIFVEPLDDSSSYYDRLLIKSANDHEATRLRFQQIKEDVYLSGSVTGVGISMHTMKPDALTGAMVLSFSTVRSDEFFRDPSSDSITSPECRYVVWGPLLDMSVVRQMFPSKAPQVKTEARQVTGGWTYSVAGDANLLYGTAGEFAITRESVLTSRKARVYFVFIRDESVIEDLQQVLVKPAVAGYSCVSCGAIYEQDSIPNLDQGQCPMCNGDLENTTVPAKYEQNRVIRRAYPYGRLIVYSGDTLLFDGENPYELEGVYPFAVYHHDRIPGDFYGGNDVELLESLQDAQNRTVCQLIDYVRLGANAPTLYPVSYKALSELGNGPAQRLPGPERLAWMPYKLSVQGFDTSSVSTLHNIIYQHFQIVSGLGSIGFSQTSSPPISATEAEIANARLSDRMKGHATALAQWASDAMTIQDQLARQFYSVPMQLAVTFPDTTVKSTEVEWQKLPKAKVRVIVSTDESVKDKLQGQNAMQLAQTGLLESPYADLFLGKLGFTPTEIKEFQMRRGLQQELVPGAPGAPPGGAAPPQPQLPGGM